MGDAWILEYGEEKGDCPLPLDFLGRRDRDEIIFEVTSKAGDNQPHPQMREELAKAHADMVKW